MNTCEKEKQEAVARQKARREVFEHDFEYLVQYVAGTAVSREALIKDLGQLHDEARRLGVVPRRVKRSSEVMPIGALERELASSVRAGLAPITEEEWEELLGVIEEAPNMTAYIESHLSYHFSAWRMAKARFHEGAVDIDAVLVTYSAFAALMREHVNPEWS